MLRSLSLLLVVFLLSGVFAVSAQGGVIDWQRTLNGGPTPFTTLTDDIPTPWEVYLPPAVTYPTVTREWWFAEASFNNHKPPSFGQILQDSERRTGRPYWIIWDQLAAVSAPNVLWLAEGDPYGASEEPEGFGFDRFDEIGGVWLQDQPAQAPAMLGGHGHGHQMEVNVIPEPATLGLWLVAIFMLLFRRGRRSQAVLTPVAIRA